MFFSFMQGSTDSSFIPPLYFDVLAASDSCESSGPLCIVAPKCELYTTLEEEHVKHSWQESFSVTHVTCEDSRDGFSCSSWGLSSIYEEVAGIFEAEGEMRLAGHHGNPQKKSQQRSSTSMAPKSSASPGTPNHRSISPGRQNERSVSQVRLNQRSISPGRPNERSSSQVRLNQRSTSPGRLNERSVSPGRLNQRSTSPGRLNERNGSQVRLNQRSTSPGRLNERSVSPGRLHQRSSSPGRPNERSGSQVRLNQRSTSPGRLNERSVSPGRLNQRSTSPGRLNERSVSPGRLNQRSTSPGRLNERSGSQVRLNQRSTSPGRLSERSVSPGRLNQRSTSPGRLNERSGSQVRLNQRSTSPGRPSQRSTSPMRPNQRSSSPERPHVRRSVSPIRSTSAVTQKRSASPVRPMQRSTSPERDHYNGSSPLKSQQKSTSQLKSQQWIGTPLLPQQRNASVNSHKRSDSPGRCSQRSTSPLGSRQRSTTPTRTYQRSTSPITSQHNRSSTNTLHQRSTSPVRPLQRNKSPERNMPISEQRSTFYAGQALSSSRRSSISNTVKKEMYSAKQSYTHTVQNPPNLGVSRRLTSSTSSLDSEGGSRGSSNRVPYTTLADIPPAKRLGHAFKKSKDLKNQTRSPGRAEVDRIFGQDRRTAEVLEAFQALEAGLIERLPDKNPSLQRRLTRRQSTPCLYPEESVLMRQELRSRRASLHPTPRTDRDYYNTPGRSSRDPSPHRTGSQGRQLSPEPEWMNRDKLLRPTGKQDKKEDNNEIPWTKREKLLKPVESVGSKPTEHPYNWQSFRSSSSEGWNKEVESVGSKQTEHPYNWQSFRSSSSEGWNKEHQGVKESFAESLGRNSLGSQHQYTRRTSVAQKEELQYKSSNTNGSQNQKTQPGYRLSAESLPVQDPVYNNITGSQYSYCYSSKNDSDGLKYKPAGPLSGHTPESQPKQYSGSYLSTECSQYKTQTEEEILSHTHVPEENIHLQTASSQESVYRNSHRPYTGKAISQTSDMAYTGYLRPQTPPVETSRKNSLEDYRQPSEFVKSSVGGQTSHADPTYGVFKGTQKPQTSELHSKEHNSTLQNNALSGSDRSVLKHSNGPVHSESQKWQVQQEATGCHLSEGQSGLWQVVKHTEFHHDHDLYLNTSVKNGKVFIVFGIACLQCHFVIFLYFYISRPFNMAVCLQTFRG
ncbi:serine/arginine repetitive matrix protein 2-like [Xenopus laevis]|uniref:Serine/arginine repetitive matrix protein 2-like n=1 Tax=Xenopus laevis TaxID=8355 RepID=A0A8J1MXS0_XENLA|nr:serine/arginine repetitive matrix protein 2-like [Xenopus laevis]